MHHPTDRITHTTAFVTPVMEHWEQEIAEWVHNEGSIQRPIIPWANALTTELHFAPESQYGALWWSWWVHNEGSIRRPIVPWANTLTTELHFAPESQYGALWWSWWVHNEGSIRRPIVPWANTLTTELHFAPESQYGASWFSWWVHTMKDQSDDPSYHERTLLPQSYISLRSHSMEPLGSPGGSTPWRINPTTHHTMSKRSYTNTLTTELHFAPESPCGASWWSWSGQHCFCSAERDNRTSPALGNTIPQVTRHPLAVNTGGVCVCVCQTLISQLTTVLPN